MHVSLIRPMDHAATIEAFRTQICRKVDISLSGNNIAPIPYGIYLFGYGQDGEDPMGMFEFYFYDQAFRAHTDPVYAQAHDLSQFGPLAHLAHVRSMIIHPDQRLSRMFQYLCAAMIWVIHQGGGRYLTGGTGEHNHDIRQLHQKAGMRFLGNYQLNGAAQRLSILDLAPVVQRVGRMNHTRFMRLDWSVFEEQRRKVGFEWQPTTADPQP